MADEIGVPKRSVAAIVGLVLGILAAIASWMPIVNNIAFVIAGIGAVFAIVGLVGTLRGTRAGKGLAIAAVVVNVAALAIVLATQSMYSAAIDDAVNGPDVVASDSQAASQDDAAAEDVAKPAADDAAADANMNLAVGTQVVFEDGVTLVVDDVQPGLTNFDGSTVLGIHVTYTNSGSDEFDYNSYNWKGQDAQGAATDPVYYSEASDALDYGTLAAGGTVSGSIYFEGDTVSALYYANVFADGPAASWAVA